ncbi:hypothetical protein EXIGLDRAFT_830269 [Exidia glandulosa HHB12029]|uniref:F-box domain-containing protein n=1 Tax=Exidia glandulosa HHB12029 TaxID=1314781 RepID=A0A165NQI1_EXIGL|nr:hypothetical protein EXIGLDRAFT_830269 [Exidia glandulosa HHB12029]
MRWPTSRPSKPPPSRCGLGDLPIELIDRVLDFAEWPYTLHSLALVSTSFNVCATHRLYSVVPIAWAQANRSTTLLQVLQTDERKATMAQTIVFDRRIDCRRQSSRSSWTPATVAFPIVDSSIERLAKLLTDTYPLLRNLREVVFVQAHPRLLVVHQLEIHHTRRERAVRAVGLGPLLRRSFDDFYMTHLSQGAMWTAFYTSAAHIQSLTCPLLTTLAPRKSLQHLNTLHIYGTGGPHRTDYVLSWTRAFVDMRELRTLTITDCGAFELLYSNTFSIRAPALTTLILHRVLFGGVDIAESFSYFLKQNSQNLEALCVYFPPLLPTAVYSSALAFLLDDDTPLEHLRRLRIFNPCEWRCARCCVRPDPGSHRCAGARPGGKGFTEAILYLIARRPHIVDVALTGLAHDARTLSTASVIPNTRDVERLLLLGADNLEIHRGWDTRLLPSRRDVRGLDEWIWDVFLTDGTDVALDRPQALRSLPKLRRRL